VGISCPVSTARVWVAMALAQETPLLLLDEPTNVILDIAHQIEINGLFQDLNRLQGHTIVAVLHDLTTPVDT